MKDFTDHRERDDDELTYKVTRTAAVLPLEALRSFSQPELTRRWWWCDADGRVACNFHFCAAETADGEPPQEAGSVERSSEGAAGRHQSQRTAGRGGEDGLQRLNRSFCHPAAPTGANVPPETGSTLTRWPSWSIWSVFQAATNKCITFLISGFTFF